MNRGNKNKPSKWYVAKKNVKTNTIVAAPEGHIINFRKEVIARDMHFINNSLINKIKIGDKLKVLSRIRHVGELLPSKLSYDKKSKQFKVILDKAITGVSEGQAIVLYKGENVLGGGEIRFD